MNSQKEPIRVLQINSGSTFFGGVSSFLLNIYKHIDHSKVQFDFLTPGKTTYEICRDEIEALGGRIYDLGIDSRKASGKIRMMKPVYDFLIAHPYDIVHINSGNLFFNVAALRVLCRAKVKNRIIHSHSVSNVGKLTAKSVAMKILSPYLNRYSTKMFACSKEAACFMFSEKAFKTGKVEIIRNGVDVKRFEYNEVVRSRMRKEFGIEDRFVVCHVGRFELVKNQKFLIYVIEELLTRIPETVLVMTGEGTLKEEVIKLARERGVAENVIFTGVRTDVENIYQMADAFAFPSIYEGLGMVLIEAQIAGLPCVASKGVPCEADITGNVIFEDIRKEDAQVWASHFAGMAGRTRKSYASNAVEQGYDINMVAARLEEYYCELQ